MEKFINAYLQKELNINAKKLESTVHVLPSRRAINYFKKSLSKQVNTSILVPEMYSIEDFIKEVSQLEILNPMQLAFSFYHVYQTVVPENEKESFDVVYNWSQVLLQDFNEIDRYLIDIEHFFSNLSAVKDLEHWSLSQQPTEMLQKYLNFWRKMPVYYKAFSAYLLQQKAAYQGLAYRQASYCYYSYLASSEKEIVFLGFNALNAAEQFIFQETIRQKKGTVIWDIDQHFLTHPEFGVARFIQSYARNWEVFSQKEEPIEASTTKFSEAKQIHTYATTKQVGQAKLVAHLLQQMTPEEMKETAVVLGDEDLLPVLLNHLPANVSEVNITMGLPLNKTPFASFFDLLISLHTKPKETWFVKDVFQLIEHVFVTHVAGKEANAFKQALVQQKLFFLTTEELLQKASDYPQISHLLKLALGNDNDVPDNLMQSCLSLIQHIKSNQQRQDLFTEYAYYFDLFFKRLRDQIRKQETPIQLSTFYQLYKDSLALESLNFEGMPFEGLQVMGMLETRLLDYKNILITSVNEGVLPAGKSLNSYIPFDLKVAFGLPTYREKDAVYSYHFFRLLQRAENIHLIYNNDASGMDKAEPSRYLLQLKTFSLPRHQYTETFWTLPTPALRIQPLIISKTPEIISSIKQLFSNGVSPSALTTYIRNPIDFYKRYVLKVQEENEFEEEVSYRLYGNILHQTLEDAYQPYVGKVLTKEDLKEIKKITPALLKLNFEKEFSTQGLQRGTNLISTHIATQQLDRFLAVEEEFLATNEVVIQQLEERQIKELKLDGIDFIVKIKGIADRIDLVNNNTLRIIDYKTGKVEARELIIKQDFSELATDYKYSKAFQVLTYALFFEEKLTSQLQLHSGILSFKNLNSGYLWFQADKNKAIDEPVITAFKQVLASLLSEILDINHPFEEKIH